MIRSQAAPLSAYGTNSFGKTVGVLAESLPAERVLAE